VAVAAFLIGAGAFVAGEHHQGPPGRLTLVTGVAGVGSYQAAMQVKGYSYGVTGAGSVSWVDSQGTEHEGGWPTCLTGPGTAHRVTFGWVPVTMPDGGSYRQVVWVDCRS
jgi:hypothetical protein